MANWSIYSDCGHVNYIDDPYNQCNFTRMVLDCHDKDGFVNYKQLTYCTFESESSCSIMLLFILMIMFFTIGTNADDFLCPLLVTISRSLKLSDNIAGVTFLAFGNGAPDIFSSIVGIKDSNPNLIIGQLYGAGIFVTTIVVGSILLQNSFEIMKRPLLRDMIFYLITTTLVWWTFFNEKIRFYNSIVFIVTYLIYVTVVIVSGYIYKRQKSKLIDVKSNGPMKSGQKMPRDNLRGQNKYVITQVTSNQVSNQNDDYEEGVVLRRIKYRQHYLNPILQRRLTIYHICSDQLQQKRSIGGNQGDGADQSDPKVVDSIYTIRTDQKNGLNHQNSNDHNGEDYNNNQFDHPNKCADDDDHSSKTWMPSKVHMPRDEYQRRYTISDPSFDESTENKTDTVVKFKFKNFAMNLCNSKRYNNNNKNGGSLMLKLIAASRFDRKLFDELNISGKFTMIVKAPIYLILTLTIPVVDNDLPMRGWIRNLNLAHLIISPQICLFLVRTSLHFEKPGKLMTAYQLHSIVLVISLVLLLVVYFTSRPNHPPKYHILFAYFGFLVSISWIYVIANEVVNILDAVRVIFNLSKFMIGLTIGAWGNSIGDFLSNTSMAKNGFPRMAISACFGGPVLNMLLGIGIPYTILFLKQQTKEISVEYNNMISVLYGTIALSLLTTMFTLLFTKFQSNKIHGYVLYAIYVCFILAAIITELELF